MHPVGLDQLADRSIDERIASLSSLEHIPRIARLISIPYYRPTPLLELDLIGKWEIIRNLIPEFSPDDLGEECRMILHLRIHFPDREYPKPDIRRESSRSV